MPPLATDTARDLPDATYLPHGLVHCGRCDENMTHTERPEAEPGYQCRPDCRRGLIDAGVLADTVGREILRHAPRIVPITGTPTPPRLAAAYARRVLTRVTVGATATDITLAWHAAPAAPDPLGTTHRQRLAAARGLAASDPHRALHLLCSCLSGVNPRSALPDPGYADTAALRAQVHLTLGQPRDAIGWATYAHHSLNHLNGAHHPGTLASLHLLATAHHRAGNHQRALHLYQQLADLLAETEGPYAHRTLATHATIALVLYHLGHCHAAQTLLADTITTHQREHPGHRSTARMTEHLAGIRRDCAASGHRHLDTPTEPS
ncbi:tetratricopeptide repeat protein [Micromonospora sp. WMMD1082]|uniref:tetratricopeptide repeat protein n=1 Tax=Micromonospora sp. WMMD1082 TaxID=3016104 RepID=UPI00241751C4|nr:tetratricopeptide repeat protein [Micromonospora sp. WMMD1082]MDG4795184.1 tetratricopeptide repeat protein [Micromonospora sp. WMMD1082]